jgi:hypothetical protein
MTSSRIKFGRKTFCKLTFNWMTLGKIMLTRGPFIYMAFKYNILFCKIKLIRMTFSKMTFGRMKFVRMPINRITFSIMKICKMLFNRVTFNIQTFNRMTFSKMTSRRM